ncbi:MAG: metallophosphoesterase [Oscillospiraceae bacterium]|nr:metallophosphoesterase [Oscillospiraceae bacterium]
MLKLWHFTDLHLHLREDPADLDARPNVTAVLHSGAITDACLAAFLDEPGCGILLISGDLTQHGHPVELREILRKLEAVQETGKRVIAITASHDLKTGGDAYAHELRKLFARFGPDDAIASFGQAFVVQLEPGLRLLCVHDHDRTSPPPWLDWAVEQIKQAKAEGESIFGMTHLPSLPPTPIYPLLSPGGLVPDHQNTTRALANAGMPFMLTGHAHMHNIGHMVTPEGSDYWDVNTSALVGYPGKFRELVFEDGRVHITSREIPHIPAFGELTSREYLRQTLETVWQNLFYGMEHDFALFCESLDRMIPPDPLFKYERYVRLAGKLLNHRLTLGRLGGLMLCKHRIPKDARKLLLRDVIIELMANTASGEEPHGPDTDIGRAFMAYGRRLQFIGNKRGIADFAAWWLSLVYDPVDDDEVVIGF